MILPHADILNYDKNRTDYQNSKRNDFQTKYMLITGLFL